MKVGTMENSMCRDITSEEFDSQYFSYIKEEQEYKSKIIVFENFNIMTKKHFNWFRKLMYRLAFDIKKDKRNLLRMVINNDKKRNISKNKKS